MDATTQLKPRFETGRIVVTNGAGNALEECQDGTLVALKLLRRHASGDWGDLDAHDRAVNNRAVKTKNRILSAYTLPTGIKLWIITDANHQVSTILLPDEY